MKSTIKSDTQGKLNKMIKGVVFSDPLVFITEFFQNSYRAKASEVSIEVSQENGYIEFKDNGTGLDKIESLLVLDYSSWNTTSEGFGLGFWSWLCFDKETEETEKNLKVVVNSNGFSFTVDKEAILSNNLNIEIEKEEEETKGFTVRLESNLIKDYDTYTDILYRVKQDGRFMPYKVILNEDEIYQEEILDKTTVNNKTKYFNNDLFEAVLSIDNSMSWVTLSYEKREVRDLYTVRGLKGRIELKAEALNLKEPDRKDYVYDNKFYKLKDKLVENIKEILKGFIKEATNEEINEYAEIISENLTVDEYEKFLGIEDTIYEIEEEERKVPEKEEYYAKKDHNILKQLIENRNNRVRINNIEVIEGMTDSINKLLKSYIYTAIAKNISESLINGSRDYYKLTEGDLSGRKITIEAVVNRVLYNSMKELGVKSINELFKTNYSAGVKLGRNFESKLIERLEHDLKVNSEERVSEELYKEIKDVLIKMDIIRQVYNDYSEPGVRKSVAYSLTRYPGLVYAFYNIISGRELITSELKVTGTEAGEMDRKYREVLEGHILEGLIISDIITTSNGETRTFNINNTEEIDIIHRHENGVISLIEVKRRKTYEPIQMRWLINKKIGEIYNSNKCVNRMVVYNGKTKVISIDPIKIGRLRKLSEDIDISVDYVYYINVDEFLLDLENYLSGNKINQMREEYENPVHNEFINIDTKGIGDGDEYSQHEDTSLLF